METDRNLLISKSPSLFLKEMFDFLRNRTKSSAELTQEALSAYLDNALAPAERQRLERQLAEDARLEAELRQMRLLKQQLAQLPRRRVPRNFTLDPALYGRPQRQPLLQLYPALQGATALAALIFILLLGLGFFQGQFGVGQPQTTAFETAQVATETVVTETIEEEAAAETMAIESALPAPAEEAAKEPVEETTAVEAELVLPTPLSDTLDSQALPVDVPPDAAEAETLATEPATGAADVADLAREGEVATDEAVADAEAFEFDTESAEVANQPAAEVAGSNLLSWQLALGVLLLVLVVLLLFARQRLQRW